MRTRIHTKQSGKYCPTVSNCLGKNISVMLNHRIPSQICPCKWNAAGLLSLMLQALVDFLVLIFQERKDNE